MDVLDYEVAAFYDYRYVDKSNSEKFPLKQIIFDIGKYSVHFCKCSFEGKVESVCNYSVTDFNECTDWVDELCKMFSEYSKEDVVEVLNSHKQMIEKKLYNYLKSDRQMDLIACNIFGRDILCSEIEYYFNKIKQNLDKIFNAIEELWESSGFDEEDVRIILIGDLAKKYLTKYYIKENMTFDPFLPDGRFVNDLYKDDESQIIIKGRELYDNYNNKVLNVMLYTDDGLGIKKEVIKMKIPKIEEDRNLGKIEYLGPIFIQANDRLEVEIDSKISNIDIPYYIEPSDGDVIDVAVFNKGDKNYIRIRRFNQPTKLFDIQIE